MSKRTLRSAAALPLLALACSAKSPTDPLVETVDGIEILVDVEDRATGLAVELTLRNTTAEQRTVDFGATCNPWIEIFEGEQTDGEPLWHERRWRELNVACLPALRRAELQPGGAVGTYHEIMDHHVLGDSLSSGTYRILVAFSMTQPQASLRLDAGTVRLESR